MSVLCDGRGEAEATIEQIDRACSETGFFVVTGHGLDLGPVFEGADRFFDLPIGVKERSAMIDHNGYASAGSMRAGGGGKEMLDIGLTGFARWPELTGFRRTVEHYQQAALAVAGDLLGAVAVALDLDARFFRDRMDRPQCFLRLLRYPPADAGVLTGRHTDYGAITLLATDGAPGLQVRTRHGDWTPVTTPTGALVVNLGDMLARWTNDRYVSTAHRVLASGRRRTSIPFFVNPDGDTEVACIPSCISAANPCRYAPITAGEFLKGRIDGSIPLDDDRA